MYVPIGIEHVLYKLFSFKKLAYCYLVSTYGSDRQLRNMH